MVTWLKKLQIYLIFRLTHIQQYARYIFAQEQVDWDENDWRKVFFSDEKTFVVGTVFVRRPKGERFSQEYIAEKPAHTKFSINIQGLISY